MAVTGEAVGRVRKADSGAPECTASGALTARLMMIGTHCVVDFSCSWLQHSTSVLCAVGGGFWGERESGDARPPDGSL